MAEIELFLQGAGIPRMTLITVPEDGSVRDVLEAARRGGLRTEDGAQPAVLLEDTNEPLALEAPLAAVGIERLGRVHVHTCTRVRVTVNFSGASKLHPFSPATTIRTVKGWAAEKFSLSEIDATEHVLQLVGTNERPDEDTHIGALVGPTCELAFDLVPKTRVEG